MIERLKRNKQLRFVIEVAEFYFLKRVSRAASSLAYFLIMTFFPVLICANAWISMLDLDVNQIFHSLDGIVPASALNIFLDYINNLSSDGSGGMLALGVGMTMLFASAAFRQLMAAMDEIYERPRRGGVRQMLFSFAFALLLLAAIYVSVYAMITSSRLFDRAVYYLGFQNPFAGQNVAYLMMFAVLLLVVLLIYRVGSPRGKPEPPVFPGALAASIALVVASMIFSNMMGANSRYSLVYGTMSSAIILLVWLYLCGTILILGCCVNAVWYRHRKRRLGNK